MWKADTMVGTRVAVPINAESMTHYCDTVRIELPENRNEQIGAVDLVRRWLPLLRDRVSFHD
jgi:hypothetical protein